MTDQTPQPLDASDRIAVYGSVSTGGHTWTFREQAAIRTLAEAVAYTAIDGLRDAGWETEFEGHALATHDWQAIDDEVDRILLMHLPVPPAAIREALAVLAPRAEGGNA